MVSFRKFRPGPRAFIIAAFVCIGLFPIVLAMYHVRANWSPLPFWDEWHTPGKQFESWCRGTLTLGELFSQHNESRKFFPRLLYFLLAWAGGWDVRKEMTVLFLEVCLLGVLLWRLLRRNPGSTTLSALTIWCVMMFLCFSSVQLENFLYGIQLEPFFPGIAAVAIASINLSALCLRTKTLANMSLALLATYTCANGMQLWVLGLPLISPSDSTPRRKRLSWYAVYVFSAALAIGCYFIGYEKPSYHPEFASLRNSFDLAHYLILWIGGYFASDYVNPFVFGIVAGALFAAVTGSAIILVNRAPQEWRTFYPWLLIGTYALVTAFVTAVGRLGFGVKQALDSRYTVFSLFFYLALVGTVFALYCTRIRNGSRGGHACFLTNAAWFVALAAFFWTACYHENLARLRFHHENRVKSVRALEWMDAIPDNPDLALIFPYVDVLRDRARVLAKHGMLRLPFVKERLAAQVQHSPQGANGSNGEIETCTFESNHNLLITGWAWLPVSGHRANCVVIGSRNTAGKFKPMSVLGTGARRADLRDRFHLSKIEHAGFSQEVSQANVLPGAVTIEGWAIDLEEEKASPLASSLSLQTEAH